MILGRKSFLVLEIYAIVDREESKDWQDYFRDIFPLHWNRNNISSLYFILQVFMHVSTDVYRCTYLNPDSACENKDGVIVCLNLAYFTLFDLQCNPFLSE